MILFFNAKTSYYVVDISSTPDKETLDKFSWLFAYAKYEDKESITGYFVGPRKEMITPWSTNAVEISQNMQISGVRRIEQFFVEKTSSPKYDSMLQAFYRTIDQAIYSIDKIPEEVKFIDDIKSYNLSEGLALNDYEVQYLESVVKKIKRKLTDSEVFGFSQVNSEHCRHKIFNGTFIIDGKEKKESLFAMIKQTVAKNPNKVVSAYKDNVAFVQGPVIEQFSPETQDKPDYFTTKNIDSVISLKAETHNFPTTVEPFNGAATGAGGEIRDRMAGGRASIPMAGTAVYMTSYSRLLSDRNWEQALPARDWLYQTPMEILIKASNGASDFGNKFGQPLICGSLLTFEHRENNKFYGFDKVIMLAGGIGYAKSKEALKNLPVIGDKIVLLGGDNYRIGMGGGAVSSVATGEYKNSIELNAVQRANPEMQKRVFNAIRAFQESSDNPIVSIHDHGAGGHLNCFSELVENTGGVIKISQLPIGDPTLSAKEIVGNESQERMGLILKEKDLKLLERISLRERAPMYIVGEVTGDMKFTFESDTSSSPIDLKLEDMFGNPPKTILNDKTPKHNYSTLNYSEEKLEEYLKQLLQLEAVACKDWLTNKVDRSVTGKVAKQQTAGELQLPLNNLGVLALDYRGEKGIATSIGHAPVTAIIDPVAGSQISILKSLTNIIWAPLTDNLAGVSLSANWMWPAKNEGEDSRLYDAVKEVSELSIALGINVPTGKDSLSMKQKYPDGTSVYSPGTVIISATAEVSNIRKVVEPVLKKELETSIFYIDMTKGGFELGGSSFSQLLNSLGNTTASLNKPDYFKKSFNSIQSLIKQDKILSGHDVAAGGLITTLLEMLFATNNIGLNLNLSKLPEKDLIKILFSESPGLVVQVKDIDFVSEILSKNNVCYYNIGTPLNEPSLKIKHIKSDLLLSVNDLRDVWYKTSYLLDKKQTVEKLAEKRYQNYKKQNLKFDFPSSFDGEISKYKISFNRTKKTGIKAAIIREKGINGDREMAYSMHLAGFDVKDVHITDLISGREDLSDINFIVFTGGFSNSDVLGSAKGWAGAFLFNKNAKNVLDNFYSRKDTMSLGICNGCQLMVELGLLYPEHENRPKMQHNDSHKFESAFVNLDIYKSNSIMLKSLEGSRLAAWVAHGEGKFQLPYKENQYNIPVKYSYCEYPANPNGSDYCAAAICSENGRHLAMMPHLERAIFPWQWAYYPNEYKSKPLTPWIEAFVNAKNYIAKITV